MSGAAPRSAGTAAAAPRVLIVGAGIAGLTLASALRLVGVDVVVAERRARFAPIASGIFINGNGLAMLERIGALNAALSRGFPSADDRMEVYDDAGAHVTTVTYPRVGGPHIPATVGMRRTHLQEVLVSRARATGAQMRLGCTVTELDDRDDGSVRVRFSDGSDETFTLVVGADGIRSQIREELFPGRGPRHSGFGVWRVVCPRPSDLDTKIMMISDGPRLGIMPISQAELYLFGVSREPADARYDPDTWREGMLERFGRFQRFAPELFAKGRSWHFTQIEEVDAEQSWVRGATILIGDAAHATTPFLAQGASMAMEDAVVLAEMVAEAKGEQLQAVLVAFHHRRAPRVAFVQQRSAAMAHEWEEWGEVEAGRARPDDLPATVQGAIDEVAEALARPVWGHAMICVDAVDRGGARHQDPTTSENRSGVTRARAPRTVPWSRGAGRRSPGLDGRPTGARRRSPHPSRFACVGVDDRHERRGHRRPVPARASTGRGCRARQCRRRPRSCLRKSGRPRRAPRRRCPSRRVRVVDEQPPAAVGFDVTPTVDTIFALE